MSKLVLFLADGTTLDVPLKRERMTIGRRADNDICLPNLAVSGEHAAVVTILADSFLEDLGSTNGTLVNGTPIAKHFLRDGDQIDIGRHMLVYVADESVQLEPVPPSLGRLEARLYGEAVEPANPPPKVIVPEAGPSGRGRRTCRRQRAAARWRTSSDSSPRSSALRARTTARVRGAEAAPRLDPKPEPEADHNRSRTGTPSTARDRRGS